MSLAYRYPQRSSSFFSSPSPSRKLRPTGFHRLSVSVSFSHRSIIGFFEFWILISYPSLSFLRFSVVSFGRRPPSRFVLVSRCSAWLYIWTWTYGFGIGRCGLGFSHFGRHHPPAGPIVVGRRTLLVDQQRGGAESGE